jgi:hypothetical protein
MSARNSAARRVLRSVVAPALRVSLPALLAGGLSGCARGADADPKPAISREVPPPPATEAPTAPLPSAAPAPTPAAEDNHPPLAADTGPPAPSASAPPAVRAPRTYPRPGSRATPPPGPPAHRYPPGPPARDPFSLSPGLAPNAEVLAAAAPEPRPTRGTRRQTDPDRAALLGRRILA